MSNTKISSQETSASENNSAEEHHRLGNLPNTWDIKEIAEITEVVGGSTPSTKEDEYWNGNIPWATPTDLTELNGKTIEETNDKITEEGLNAASTHKLPANSLLMTSRATIGECAINTVEMTTNQGFKSLVPTQEANVWYLLYRMIETRGYLESLGAGSTFDEVSKSVVQTVEIPVPPLEEQRKIATVLYNIDQAIQKTEEIIEQTKRVKKGLTQELLIKGYFDHQNFHEVRIGPLKYNIPEKWSLIPIGELGEVITGDTPSTDDRSNFGDDYPFVTPEDLENQKYVTEIRRGITEAGMKETKRIPKDAVMIDCIGSNLGKVAISKRPLATNQQINSVITSEEYDEEFLYYCLQFISNFIKAQAGATATPILRKSSFQALNLPKPPLEEQEKIGKVLSDFDKKIGENRMFKNKLDTIKKALMQDLLTGNVRTHDKLIEVLDEVKSDS